MYEPSKVPRLKPLRGLALLPRPGPSVCNGAEVDEVPDHNDQQQCGDLQAEAWLQGRRDKIKDTAREKDRKVKSWEVVVQEELTLHDVERKVVQRPAYEEEAAQCVVLDHAG